MGQVAPASFSAGTGLLHRAGVPGVGRYFRPLAALGRLAGNSPGQLHLDGGVLLVLFQLAHVEPLLHRQLAVLLVVVHVGGLEGPLGHLRIGKDGLIKLDGLFGVDPFSHIRFPGLRVEFDYKIFLVTIATGGVVRILQGDALLHHGVGVAVALFVVLGQAHVVGQFDDRIVVVLVNHFPIAVYIIFFS